MFTVFSESGQLSSYLLPYIVLLYRTGFIIKSESGSDFRQRLCFLHFTEKERDHTIITVTEEKMPGLSVRNRGHTSLTVTEE